MWQGVSGLVGWVLVWHGVSGIEGKGGLSCVATTVYLHDGEVRGIIGGSGRQYGR